MRTAILLFALTGTLSFNTFGQRTTRNKDTQWIEEAEELIANSMYSKAISVYLDVLENDGSNEMAKIKLAQVYFRIHDYSESMEWYESVLKIPYTPSQHVTPVSFYNYAELLLMEERVDDAAYWFELYGQQQPDDTRAARKLEGIRKMSEFKSMLSKYQVEAVPFNSVFNDFAPTFYEDGLVFVSDRHEVSDDKALDYFDLYLSESTDNGSFTTPVKFSENINTVLHEGPAFFYDNDQKVIFTRNIVTNKLKSSEEKVVLHLQLFYSEKDASVTTWKTPEGLSINNKDYSLGHPSLSSDGRYLYFSSNLPGSLGGTDIFVSEWVNGAWGTPKNLGNTMNTEGNEMFPFIYQDSILYFASDGHAGLGGLDIYRISLHTSQLKNLGYPVNTSKDDFGLVVQDDLGYFSSNRGKNDDIYQVTFLPDEVPPVQDSVVLADVIYTVQILALKSAKLVNRKFLKDLRGVLKHDGKDGFHRYTYGSYSTLEEASAVLEQIKSKGYSDAFIRREARYAELSKREGIEIDRLYK